MHPTDPNAFACEMDPTCTYLEYREKKDKARLFAIELFPQAAKDLRLKKHNDRAEALLLTEWYIRYGG